MNDTKNTIESTSDIGIKKNPQKRYVVRKKIIPKVKNSHALNVAEKQQDNTPTALHKNNYNPFSPSNQLFSLIRQKTGYSQDKFIQLLRQTLTTQDFLSIKTDNEHSLFSYSVLYGNETIFSYLMDNFNQYLTQPEIEEKLLVLALNKQPIFLEKLLTHCKTKLNEIQPKEAFLLKVAKMSYRQECNEILIHWLEPFCQQIGVFFWQACLNEHNVVLFEQALHSKLKETLRENRTMWRDEIEQISKTHATEQAFKKIIEPTCKDDLNQKSVNTKNSLITPVSKTTEKHKSLFDENKKTEITIKRKKVLPN